MGGHRIGTAKVEVCSVPIMGRHAEIWARDLDQVTVYVGNLKIDIPGEHLREIIAEHYREQQISKMEQMTNEEALESMGLT